MGTKLQLEMVTRLECSAGRVNVINNSVLCILEYPMENFESPY